MIRSFGKKASRSLALVAGAVAVLALAWPSRGQDQAKPADHAKHAPPGGSTAKAAAATNRPLADQLAELRAKVATLEAALEQRHRGGVPAAGGGPTPGMGMGMMGGGQGMGAGMGTGRGGTGMGMMGGGMGMARSQGMGMTGGGQGMGGGKSMMDDMDMMGGGGMGMMKNMDMGMTAGDGMGIAGGKGGGQGMGMGMMDDMDMGMGAMGRARGMAGMTMGSALPGFPGASHLYHVGSTGFFLDHGEHISLTDAQKAELSRIKERALLGGATARRKVDEAEQALWSLTAADEPDAEAIAAKAKEIEAVRSEQRLAFIRAVGEAAKVLTPEQRQQLVGAAAPPAPAP